MENAKLLVINYKLPTEPSRLRVSTWRKLKKIGAVNIQQSMWILSNNEDNYNALNKIAQDIEENEGDVLLMQCDFLNNKYEQKVISYFNEVRVEEYNEFIDECGKYLKEIQKEISVEKFTFAELDEEEEEFNKLISWHEKIETRDIFYSSNRDTAKLMIKKIEKAFDDYSEMVYKHNNN